MELSLRIWGYFIPQSHSEHGIHPFVNLNNKHLGSKSGEKTVVYSSSQRYDEDEVVWVLTRGELGTWKEKGCLEDMDSDRSNPSIARRCFVVHVSDKAEVAFSVVGVYDWVFVEICDLDGIEDH